MKRRTVIFEVDSLIGNFLIGDYPSGVFLGGVFPKGDYFSQRSFFKRSFFSSGDFSIGIFPFTKNDFFLCRNGSPRLLIRLDIEEDQDHRECPFSITRRGTLTTAAVKNIKFWAGRLNGIK